jgi:hypothetical protein
MEAALAELSVEDVKDEADDKDFFIVRGEDSPPLPSLTYTFSQTRRMYLDLTLKARTRRRKRKRHSKPLTLEKCK